MLVKTLKLAAVVIAAALVPALAFGQTNNYVGSDKCKTCHNAKDKGEAYTKWKASPHAKAYETLAGDAAKKVNKDAQKDAKCLKCHDTGADLAADKLAKSFKKDQGVQCEACHGPGEKHVKARMASEDDSNVTDTEIIKAPTEKTCVACHNKESPTFKGFNFAEYDKKIEHKNPTKKSK
jgi:hypothetical protein